MYASHARAAAFRVAAFALFAGTAPLLAQAPHAPQAPVTRDALERVLGALRASAPDVTLPPADRFSFGDSTIGARARVTGPVAVAGGTLHVRGVVDGDVVTYRGDVVVHEGGDVRGNALTIEGRVTLDGGRVTGDVRALSGDIAPGAGAAASASPQRALLHELTLTAGWLAVLMVVGIGVLVFASSNLGAVSEALERDFGRAFLAGVGAQLALLPALVILCIALALSVLGILLIPFAIVAYLLVAAGLVTLGLLAVASITGRTVLVAADAGERARRMVALRGMLFGLVVLMSPWFVAAALAWSPVGGAVARTVAIGVTWAACTAGLGAALISRGGVRRVSARAAQRALASASWQTPTPVSGVTAGRRPTPMATPGPR